MSTSQHQIQQASRGQRQTGQDLGNILKQLRWLILPAPTTFMLDDLPYSFSLSRSLSLFLSLNIWMNIVLNLTYLLSPSLSLSLSLFRRPPCELLGSWCTLVGVVDVTDGRWCSWMMNVNVVAYLTPFARGFLFIWKNSNQSIKSAYTIVLSCLVYVCLSVRTYCCRCCWSSFVFSWFLGFFWVRGNKHVSVPRGTK